MYGMSPRAGPVISPLVFHCIDEALEVREVAALDPDAVDPIVAREAAPEDPDEWDSKL